MSNITFTPTIPRYIYLFCWKNPDISLEILTKCLQDVSFWISSRKLKLDPDKTEFLLIGSKVRSEIFSKCFPIRLLTQAVTHSPSARHLGIFRRYKSIIIIIIKYPLTEGVKRHDRIPSHWEGEGTRQNTLSHSEAVEGHTKIPSHWQGEGTRQNTLPLTRWRDTSKYPLTD